MSNLLIAANLGIMAFFSVAVAPTIFKVLKPRIHAARDTGDRKAFGVLHGLSVVINFVQLAIFGGLLWTST